ncbi:MAG TPA: NPCBM/NEW2 domain-containing protein [Gemmatimonadaceae bacterium]|nr:NPCBM/NEW2 domain-containing protein [Gemmatimonadaceae bacterium]
MRRVRAVRCCLVAAVLIVGSVVLSGGTALAQARGAMKRTVDAGPVTPWPRPVPIRLKPHGRDDLMITTLGEVSTPLADGTFDPVADRVTTADGRVIEHYYRASLGIRYYAPIDKSVFAVPPSGWCTWYYYYRDINPGEVIANAHWIAKNLAPFGARYVQLDDGWEGMGQRGPGAYRDWTTIDPRFRAIGLRGIADSIRALGLQAGIWIAPHGQSNAQVAHRSGAFLWASADSTASTTWEGRYLVDPTAPATPRYLENLFSRLRKMGFSYFKIDGQTIVVHEYATKSRYMAGPVPPGDSAQVGADLYRNTLRMIRHAIGPTSYLLASWGTPLAGAGLYNGSRTGGDIVQGWDGFLGAASTAQRWNFLHNVVWYSDPDVLLVRPPMSEGTARAWATMIGLTGQSLMSSDRLTDLPPSRVELLKRVYPATDIRPLDLFRPANTRKPIVDLKVNHLGRAYDVVGVFNYSADSASNRLLSWSALGLDSTALYHVYDFWNGTYYGAWRHGVFIDVPPADVRVITLVRATDRPVLISTSRHITQGWVDVLARQSGGTVTNPTLSGRSRVIGGDAYTLTVGLPRGAHTFRLASARARGSMHGAPVRVSWASHQGYATATITTDSTQVVSWDLHFAPATPYVYPVTSPTRVEASATSLSSALVSWPVEYYGRSAYQVAVDGRPVGEAFTARANLDSLVPGRTYDITVRSMWADGSSARKPAELHYTPAVPDSVFVSALRPLSVRQDWEQLGTDRSVRGGPLTVAGTVHAKGVGTLSDSELRYQLFGRFARFRASAGLDDGRRRRGAPARAVFEVRGDGRVLWRSDTVSRGGEAVPVDVDVSGVHTLSLDVVPLVQPNTDRDDAVPADWLEARLIADRSAAGSVHTPPSPARP